MSMNNAVTKEDLGTILLWVMRVAQCHNKILWNDRPIVKMEALEILFNSGITLLRD